MAHARLPSDALDTRLLTVEIDRGDVLHRATRPDERRVELRGEDAVRVDEQLVGHTRAGVQDD